MVQFLLKKCACINIIMIINTLITNDFFFIVYLFYRLDMKWQVRDHLKIIVSIKVIEMILFYG